MIVPIHGIQNRRFRIVISGTMTKLACFNITLLCCWGFHYEAT